MFRSKRERVISIVYAEINIDTDQSTAEMKMLVIRLLWAYLSSFFMTRLIKQNCYMKKITYSIRNKCIIA